MNQADLERAAQPAPAATDIQAMQTLLDEKDREIETLRRELELASNRRESMNRIRELERQVLRMESEIAGLRGKNAQWKAALAVLKERERLMATVRARAADLMAERQGVVMALDALNQVTMRMDESARGIDALSLQAEQMELKVPEEEVR